MTTPTPTSSTSTLSGPACGFVPGAALATVLGTTRYTTTGSLTGIEPDRTGACSVFAPDNDAPAIQLSIGPGSTSLAGASAASVRAQVDKHPSGWFIYPTSQGVGWAHRSTSRPSTGRR